MIAELEGALASSNLAFRMAQNENETKEKLIVHLHRLIGMWQKVSWSNQQRIQELEEQRHGVLVALGYDHTPVVAAPGVPEVPSRAPETAAVAGGTGTVLGDVPQGPWILARRNGPDPGGNRP